MKSAHFDVEPDGFYGAYWKSEQPSDCALIAMLGDDPEDYLARSAMKWVSRQGINVMTMSPAKKDHGHHNYPLERIETAIRWLKRGNRKIGIVGASTTGTLALTAASYFPNITLTIAMTPSDFIAGVHAGKRMAVENGRSRRIALSYRGEPLPYMPFCYKHPQYWQVIQAETKGSGDFLRSRKLFEDSEKAHPITEAETIKVERIKGKLLIIGAEDDGLWPTAKYIRRMEKRLSQRPHGCETEIAVYEHGTHFVFPEGVMKTMLPVGLGLFMRLMFKAAKQNAKACRQTREDIDRRVTADLAAWRDKK
ncbi:MAG: acyl-CoA thioester hydrolase/BAAT C-terminal domain-containing protein [Christensenellales bacterium]